MPTATSIQRGMASVGSNATGATTTATTTSTSVPEARPTLSEREQLKIEFYKTYDVMTGIRIAATLGGFFSLMVLLVVYKSRRRCKSNRQLQDPRLTAAAEAAVAEAEAEERALAAALEAIARLPPKPARGPRRSLCVEPFRSQYIERRLPLVAPRFASLGGGYDSLLAAPVRRGSSRRLRANRRCSSVTCSSTASSYLERRGSAMAMPCLPPPPSFPRHGAAYEESWELYHHPIDIQVIQPTPELSPCGSEAGLYGAPAALRQQQQQQQQRRRQYRHSSSYSSSNGAKPSPPRRAPLASMGSVDPPEPDSRSLGSDSVFLDEAGRRAAPDTEDEVSGFSTDSSDGPGGRRSFLEVPPKKKRPPERWDGCAGCVPRRRRASPAACQTCMTISASVEAPRSPVLSTTTSSSQNSVGLGGGLMSPPCSTSSPIELRHRPSSGPSGTSTARPSSSPAVWSQETLF
ncbi:uncharacterized protein LOC100679586 isoform X2 [Nasonia vitripennis]|uniref:Uncharacterized protein n=1 Tax=Nasonia vitripennis TaxID=7425 RepID=A0A7M7Q895_NASVI|nr:uncharacterized protein LOC100679586 isoform X2 [Nasonia vitripennis]